MLDYDNIGKDLIKQQTQIYLTIQNMITEYRKGNPTIIKPKEVDLSKQSSPDITALNDVQKSLSSVMSEFTSMFNLKDLKPKGLPFIKKKKKRK